MKKILVALALCMVSVMSFGQYTNRRLVKNQGYWEDVYINILDNGVIRFVNNYGFVLFGVSSNSGEYLMPSIFLGVDTIQAIETLQNIEETIKHKNHKIFIGYDGRVSEISPDGVLYTEGLKGGSYALCAFEYNKAIEALRKFLTKND